MLKSNLDSVVVLPDVVLVAVLRLRIISPLLNSRSISNELFFSAHHQLLHSQERMMSWICDNLPPGLAACAVCLDSWIRKWCQNRDENFYASTSRFGFFWSCNCTWIWWAKRALWRPDEDSAALGFLVGPDHCQGDRDNISNWNTWWCILRMTTPIIVAAVVTNWE